MADSGPGSSCRDSDPDPPPRGRQTLWVRLMALISARSRRPASLRRSFSLAFSRLSSRTSSTASSRLRTPSSSISDQAA